MGPQHSVSKEGETAGTSAAAGTGFVRMPLALARGKLVGRRLKEGVSDVRAVQVLSPAS